MRKPTPVTISSITAESGSESRPNGIFRLPDMTHVHGVTVAKRVSGATPSIAMKSATASANAASTTPQPISEMAIRGSARPKSPSATKPASGRSRMYGVKFSILPLQRIQLVHVDLVARAEDRDDDCQAHHHLGGGDGQHQEDEHPAVHRVQEVRE